MVVRFSNQTVKRLQKELKVAQSLNNLRMYKIVWGLLLLHEQRKIHDIAALLNISERTAYNWFATFLVDRFSWLVRHHFQGRGRKPKLSQEQKDELYQIVVDGPEKHGFDCGAWNSAMVGEVIQRKFKVTYNPRYVCSILHAIGLTYQKAKFVSDRIDDKEYRKQRKHWENKTWPAILERARELKAVILFGDEVSFAQWGSLTRTWGPRGRQPLLKTSGKRKGLKMFGVIEFVGGGFEYMECDGKFNGDSYVEFLKRVLSKYSCPVILIEDGAPYHNGESINNFKQEMEAQSRLFVYRLPSYSPDKNPIEKLWKNTKKAATHLKYFPTFDDLRQAVIKAFNKYLEDTTKIICVMKKLRTEAGIA
jgi:transposase